MNTFRHVLAASLVMSALWVAPALAQTVPFRPGGISQPCVMTTATAPDASTVPVCAPVYYAGGGSAANPNANPATVYSGKQTCTTGAVALPSQALVNGIVIQSTTTNTGTAYTGPAGVTTATGYSLVPGQAISYGVSNLSAVYLICSNATDTVTFTGN